VLLPYPWLHDRVGFTGRDIMAIKFNHQEVILALRDGFSKYFEAYMSIKVEWGKNFAENDFRDSYISGKGKNEKLVLLTEIIIGTKSLPVKFAEDRAGSLTIEVSGKPIYTIKPRGRISQDLVIAFTNSIAEGL
jgi:hypothetical protein